MCVWKQKIHTHTNLRHIPTLLLTGKSTPFENETENGGNSLGTFIVNFTSGWLLGVYFFSSSYLFRQLLSNDDDWKESEIP